MNVFDLLGYLFGKADSIRAVATTTNSLWVGAVFVASATIARSWIRRDLRARPIFLVLPFLASTIAAIAFSALLCVWWFGSIHELPSNFLSYFPIILSLFWMTGPLAWIYGLPSEHLKEDQAVKAKLFSLLIVSVWRVIILMAAIHVLFGIPFSKAALFVLTFGNLVALAAIFLTRRGKKASEGVEIPRVLMLMGVISPKHAKENPLLPIVSGLLTAVLIISAMISIPYFLSAAYTNSPDVQSMQRLTAAGSVSNGLWGLSFGSLVIWLLLLPVAQKRTALETRLDKLFECEDFDGAVNLLGENQRSSFPPGWRLPLDSALSGEHPDRMFRFVESLQQHGAQLWVKTETAEIFGQFVSDPLLYWYIDKDIARVKNLVEGAGFKIEIDIAVETLHQLDRLHDAHQFLKQFQGHFNDAEDESVLEESPDFAKESIHESNTELFNGTYQTWPEMTPARIDFRQRMLEVAGEHYEPRRAIFADPDDEPSNEISD